MRAANERTQLAEEKKEEVHSLFYFQSSGRLLIPLQPSAHTTPPLSPVSALIRNCEDNADPCRTPAHPEILLGDLAGLDVLTILRRYEPLEPGTGVVVGPGRRVLFQLETTIQSTMHVVGYLFDTGSSVTTIVPIVSLSTSARCVHLP